MKFLDYKDMLMKILIATKQMKNVDSLIFFQSIGQTFLIFSWKIGATIIERINVMAN